MNVAYAGLAGERSAIGSLDVRTKLLFLLAVSILVLIWQDPVPLGLLFLLTLALCLMARLGRRLVFGILAVMLPAVGLILLIQGLFSPYGQTRLMSVPDAVPWLGGRALFTREGLTFGVAVAFRLLAPALAFPLAILTTNVNDLVVGLVRTGLPYKVAFLFSVSLRFVPYVIAELAAIKDAQRLRGLAIERMGLLRRVPVFAAMLVPLILGALMKAQTLEIALQSKGFSGSRDRTYLNADAVRLRRPDRLLIAAMTLFLAGAVIARAWLGLGAFRP